jgi:hypothetical protein
MYPVPARLLPYLQHPVDRLLGAPDDGVVEFDLVLDLLKRGEGVFERDLVHVLAAAVGNSGSHIPVGELVEKEDALRRSL